MSNHWEKQMTDTQKKITALEKIIAKKKAIREKWANIINMLIGGLWQIFDIVIVGLMLFGVIASPSLAMISLSVHACFSVLSDENFRWHTSSAMVLLILVLFYVGA